MKNIFLTPKSTFKHYMLKVTRFTFLFLFMLGISKGYAQRGNPRVEYMGKSIDQMIYEFMEQQKIPGMTLAIVQAPYIPRVVGYGVTDANTENGESLASAGTIWPAGPISQGYVAVAIFQLYEAGKLDIYKSVDTYVKNLPAAWKNVTVFELMQHASGIADFRDAKGYNPANNYSFTQLVDLVKGEPLAFSPGTKVSLSATNFSTLAEVVEKTSGMSYHDFVWKNQINPMELKQTFFKEDLNKLHEDELGPGKRHKKFKSQGVFVNASETTKGYILNAKTGQLDATAANVPSLKGFSDIYASAQDISTWDIGLAGSIYVKKPENRDLIYKPTKLKDGSIVPAMAGWEFFKHKGFFDIKGSSSGHSSYLSRFTAAKDLVCVTLMCNLENVDLTDLGRRIAAAFDSSMGSNINPEYVFTMESSFGVNETVQNIKNMLTKNNVPIFANFDHKRNAEEAKLQLADNQVIVFGNPAVGTHLMQENPSISQDLPLRINVWEDATGRVWTGFTQTKSLEKKYNMPDNKILANIQKMLEKLVYNATHTYKIK